MENLVKSQLTQLFQATFNETVNTFESIPLSGSNRRYFRLINDNRSVIGTFNTDLKENQAFVGFTKHFKSKGVKVPSLYAEDLEKGIYLQQDLGNTTLLNTLFKQRIGTAFPNEVKQYYKQAVTDLAHLQIKGGEGLDYSLCYPTQKFDARSMYWDCNYFKYYFLKAANIPFNEELLDEDFQRLIRYINRAKKGFFVFRDFQGRNIMLNEGKPYYIDYQGGRQGALQYDLASLLYQAKAQIPHDVREELLQHYIGAVKEFMPVEDAKFIRYYYGFVLIRCIQVLGAYGFRGIYERKSHFLTSIPYALANVEWLLENANYRFKFPHLRAILKELTQSEYFRSLDKKGTKEDGLTITINSFSFRRGVPHDTSGNGGGFIFDCRAIHNPGRYKPYKKLTGRDKPVQDFLETKSNIRLFINDAIRIVEKSVDNYLERQFTSLQINFGCTGGQHRSVYSADNMAKHIRTKYPQANVVVNHIEQELKNWKN